MKQTEINIPDNYLSAIDINGLHGRMLNIPSKTKKFRKSNILLLYGHHSSLERMYSLAMHFSNYGNIVMPDLPGFGGMNSFYKIGQKPTLDAMADYVATFIKLHYKNQKFMLCGMSYGFLVVTRMLQKYPELTKQVTVVLSVVGFTSKEDFSFDNGTYMKLKYSAKVLSWAPFSFITKHIIITKPLIKLTYNLMANKHAKMKDASPEERKRRINFEVYLWKCNDVRTYFSTSYSFLSVDLTNIKKINMPLLHVTVKNDQYFNEKNVENNLLKIYKDLTVYTAKLPNHAPTVISSEKEASKIIPPALGKYLKTNLAAKV
jgi:pimeloyl-ACP methyl ester carboxylesterase